MTAIISKALYDEITQSAREKYPACAQTIKDMYRAHAKKAGKSVTEEQLDSIVIKILGKCP